jgi:hypothetical protein
MDSDAAVVLTPKSEAPEVRDSVESKIISLESEIKFLKVNP